MLATQRDTLYAALLHATLRRDTGNISPIEVKTDFRGR